MHCFCSGRWLAWAKLKFVSLSFELQPFTRFELSQSCVLNSRHLSLYNTQWLKTMQFGPKILISFHCRNFLMQQLLRSLVFFLLSFSADVALFLCHCYKYIFVKIPNCRPKKKVSVKKWQISPKSHGDATAHDHHFGEIILIWKHCNYFQTRNVFSMEPKVFSRRFFEEIHSKISTISRIGPEVSWKIKIIIKNQPKISENPYFWNDRVLEGNTWGKVQIFYKNAIFVIFLNWCKVWNLYHDPFREETSVGNWLCISYEIS